MLSFRLYKDATMVLRLKKVKEDRNTFCSGECNFVVQLNGNLCRKKFVCNSLQLRLT